MPSGRLAHDHQGLAHDGSGMGHVGEGLGDGGIGEFSVADVDGGGVAGVKGGEPVDTQLGQFPYVWQRGVAQRLRAGSRDGPGDVGDTVVKHAVDDVGRLAVRCRPGGRKTSTPNTPKQQPRRTPK